MTAVRHNEVSLSRVFQDRPVAVKAIMMMMIKVLCCELVKTVEWHNRVNTSTRVVYLYDGRTYNDNQRNGNGDDVVFRVLMLV